MLLKLPYFLRQQYNLQIICTQTITFMIFHFTKTKNKNKETDTITFFTSKDSKLWKSHQKNNNHLFAKTL